MKLGTKHYGAHIARESGSEATRWLCVRLWWLRTPQRLGFRYLSFPINRAAFAAFRGLTVREIIEGLVQ